MNVRRTSAVIAAAALMSAVCGAAHAADRSKPMDFTVKAEPTTAAPNGAKVTKFDASKGRFGVTLGVQQQNARETTANDVAAGAYFRITPSIRVGGSVALGEQELTPRGNNTRPADQPRVRLETAFKF